MTDLKTLKELKTVAELLWKVKAPLESGKMEELNQFVRIQELKAEAVKWVKNMDINKSPDYCDGMMNFIMHFFNLTKEDLQ